MNKHFLIIFAVSIMITSTFAVAFGSSVVSSNNTERYSPLLNTGGDYVGNLTIYPNGTVSDANLLSISGYTYTLLSNVDGTLTILRNNTVFNGNGYTINGRGLTAVKSFCVNGLAIENLIVKNSTAGMYLNSVTNSAVMNDTLIGSSTLDENFVQICHSSNVSVGYSNFLLNSTETDSYAIIAEYDQSLNVSHNTLSGSTCCNFVYANRVVSFSAWGNSIMSTDSSISNAFYVRCGRSAILGDNYVNHTEFGINVYWEESATTLHNQIYNTKYGLYFKDVTTVNSYQDSVNGSTSAATDIQYSKNVFIQHDNLSKSSCGVKLYSDENVTIANSDIYVPTDYGVYSSDGFNLNLYSDVIKMSNTTLYDSVSTDDMSGWVNIVHDNIFVPDGTGLYLYYTPHFNVSSSFINATYNIYILSSIMGATISNNSLITMNGGYTFDMYRANCLYNFSFINNTVESPLLKHASYGIYTYSCDDSGNVLVRNNTFINSNQSIYLYIDSRGGGSVSVQNNTFLNATTAINVHCYSNVQVTGNNIQNISNEGILVETFTGGQASVSYNIIQDSPESSGFCVGVEVFYGNDVISHNTIVNGGSDSKGINVKDNIGTSVFDNSVNHTRSAYYLYENNVITFFNNGAYNSNYGLYSYFNHHFAYYSNTFGNDNYSLFSCYDFMGSVFANNFVDTQSNSHGIYFLYLYEPYGNLTFYHNNFLNETVNSTIINYYCPYEPISMNAPLPVGGNYWSNYTGSGSNGIGTTPMPFAGSLVDHYPLTSMWKSPTVTFLETGLPFGTTWSVTLNSSMKSSSSGSIVYSPTNGLYMNVSYSISSVSGFVASDNSGFLALDGKNAVIAVEFTPYNYSVKFTESNLPAGTTWSVTLNGTLESSSTSTISFSVPNGTYNYSIESVSGYHTTSAENLTVDRFPVSVNVAFIPNEYTLTVSERGLPAGDSWMFTINGTQHFTVSDTISIQTVSGTYNVSASGPYGYSVSVLPSVTVSNANTTFTLTFSAVPEYTLLVTETGLVSGSSWTFAISGHSYTTNLSALYVQVTAGTYKVNASGPSGYTVKLKATSVAVSGNTTLAVDFSPQHTSSSSGAIYEGIGLCVLIGGVAAALGVMFATGTGIFRSFRKGGKSP